MTCRLRYSRFDVTNLRNTHVLRSKLSHLHYAWLAWWLLPSTSILMCQSPVFQTFERKLKILFLLPRNKLILYLQTKEMGVQGELVFYLLLTTYLDWRKNHFINFFSPHFLFDHVFIWNELSKVIWPLWINEFKFIPQTSFLLWWVSFLRASFQLWAFFPTTGFFSSKRQQCSFLSSLLQVSGLEPPSHQIWFLALLLLLYPPGASDSGLGEQWSSSA